MPPLVATGVPLVFNRSDFATCRHGIKFAKLIYPNIGTGEQEPC